MFEAMVSSILEQLKAVVADNAIEEMKLVTGVEEELRWLEENFKDIQCVLGDAEEKQVTEKYVKRWLDKLKEVAYDMEDVLDEWNTALSKSKLQKDEAEKPESSCRAKKIKLSPLASFFSLVHQISSHRDIAVKIRDIHKRLDAIAKQKDIFCFKEKIRQSRRPEGSTSHVVVSEIHGRNMIKEELVTRLLSEDIKEGCVETISIVGMGGIGKTSLAQLVFNHVKHVNFFEKTVWICVSDVFDQANIAREILAALDGAPPNIHMSNQQLLEKICERITKTRFFCVFDDVWTENAGDWEGLRAVFQSCQVGGRILATTRNINCAEVMRSSHVIRLNLLSDEICWDILKQMAFIGREGEYSKFEKVGMEIAKKCRGLPLAAKTLGSLLRYKRREEEWESILNSEFWKLDKVEEFIFRPLLLSYYDLHPIAKRCLLYCAVFPKDYEMDREDLILHWEAQGFFTVNEIELKGEECFYHLASRSFFQDFKQDDCGNIYECKMHDLIHDFLRFLTKDEIADIGHLCENSTCQLVLKNTRYSMLHLYASKTQFSVSMKVLEKVRNLIIMDYDYFSKYYLSCDALRNLFNNAKSLRLLEFGTTKLEDELPEEIENLIHLRCLKLGSHQLSIKLPESLCKLHNLQCLDLKRTAVRKLPNEMEKLINLKYLYTYGCLLLDEYPKGIGKLTGLKRLDRIVARVDRNDPRAFSIGDLEKLDLLCGRLDLHMVGDKIDSKEAERAKLDKKSHLTVLYISLVDSSTPVHAYPMNEVVQALKPPASLYVNWDWV